MTLKRESPSFAKGGGGTLESISWAAVEIEEFGRSGRQRQAKEGAMEVEMKIRGLMMDPVTQMPIVVLKDVQGQAILPIWVGAYEANAIALEIEKVQTPRPMTHDLLKNVLMGLEGKKTGIKHESRYFVLLHIGK